jgi:hypothetical protein
MEAKNVSSERHQVRPLRDELVNSEEARPYSDYFRMYLSGRRLARKPRTDREFALMENPASDGSSNACPFCGLSSVTFDPGLDINICVICGAREPTEGWQVGVRRATDGRPNDTSFNKNDGLSQHERHRMKEPNEEVIGLLVISAI